jgi:hypothetical protein
MTDVVVDLAANVSSEVKAKVQRIARLVRQTIVITRHYVPTVRLKMVHD